MTSQLPLDFTAHHLAKRNDVSTSHDAAASMKEARARQHEEILVLMRWQGRSLTAEEIGELLGFPVWRRMVELERAGLVTRNFDEKRRNHSGRMAFTYSTRT